MQPDPEALAGEVLQSLDTRTQVQPFTSRHPDFDAKAAYAVTHKLRSLRVERGDVQIGRKIGFTNRNIWAEYGVYEPIWGDVYASTVFDVQPGSRVRISHLPQPRIEPEIVLGLEDEVRPGMSDGEIAARIGWVAHGFEIVQSIFPDWKFRVADCVADGGLHGALFVGRRRELSTEDRQGLAAILSGLAIELFCDGRSMDTGIGANVLDGPVQALRHLTGVLAGDPLNPPLRKGELVTTGTLTRAFPIEAGQRWSTQVLGFDLPGMDVEFC